MNRIRNISLAVSVFVHTSLIGFMNSSGWMGKWFPSIPVREKSEVSLQFVEIPEEIPESKIEKDTKVISDKTREAKDKIEGEVKDKKAKAKEAAKGKQIAKNTLSPEPASPMPPLPVLQVPDKAGGMEDIRPLESKPEPEKKIEYEIINIPEVSESIFSTEDEGPLTFDTKAHKIGPYFKEVKGRIENYWLRYLIFRYQNTAPEESEAVVSFKILPNGDVSEVSVLEYSGDELFRDFCVASVTSTSPFSPLPENLLLELKKEGGLNIVFTFRYR